MNAELAIVRFAAVARPMILAFFPPNSCIAASRIAVEVLQRFGVSAEAVPVSLIVEAKARALAFVSGVKLKGGATELRPSGPDSWAGHVVVIASGFGKRRYLIDASFDQCSMPDHGVPVPPCVLVVPIEQASIEPENIAAELALETDTGEMLHVMYWPLRDRSFVTAPAWETGHLQPVIELICEQMQERVGAADSAS